MPVGKQTPGGRPRPSASMFLRLFGGIWCGVGLLLASIFVLVGGGPWHDWILNDRGVSSSAEVIEVRATHARINSQRVQEIDYRFADAHGAMHDGRSGTIERSLIASANARQRLAVEYDPEYPARNRLAGTRISFFGPFLRIPLFFAVMGALLFGVGWRKKQREAEA